MAQEMLFGFHFIPATKAAAAVHRGVAGDGRHESCTDALGDVIDEATDAGDFGAETLDEVFPHVDIVYRRDNIDDVRENAKLFTQCRTNTIDPDNTDNHDQIAIEYDQ